ncbi:helix-turn-helix transcriptional regulator [Streptomyces sp. 4F14]|uniref:helix-turn-helix transcriptional regulator n=1 Tax=Streptomyces sp. 4F14 TaxID=3394380 RepID=UPI003A835A7E
MPDWVLTRRWQVGERIREERLRVGLSQVRLGQAIGRDHRTVHRWETAQRIPNLEDLLLLAHVFGIELPDLVR